MSIRLGFEPVELNVVLSADGDFVSSLVADTPWPDGTVIELVFGDGTRWAAEVAGVSASWDVPAATVAALLTGSPRAVELLYTSGGTTLLWAKGLVIRR